MEQDTPLSTRTIKEITASRVKEEYLSRVMRYLESLGCVVESLGPGSYHVVFPEGTKEETYAGKSTQWAHRTTIRLPDGTTLNKTVFVALPDKGTFTSLGIPISALRGSEPK